MTTKEKIIYEALSLFSVYGYQAVTIRQIASKVGIKESSVYNHFESKWNILEVIIAETLNRYNQTLLKLKVPNSYDKDVSDLYDDLDDEAFLSICTNIFLFYLKDDYISKLRRLLTIEQYANKQIGKTFKYIFIDRVLETQTQVLQRFIDAKRFIDGDAYVMALQFYAPVFLLLYKYDKSNEDEEEALKVLRQHAFQYNNIYRLK